MQDDRQKAAYTDSGEVAFLAALAQAIVQIDGPTPPETTAVFLRRIDQILVSQLLAGQCSKQAFQESMQLYQQLRTTAYGIWNEFGNSDFPPGNS